MQRQDVPKLTFWFLVTAHFFVSAYLSGSWAFATGASVVAIPVSIAIGRVALWFGEKLWLFARNIRDPGGSTSELGWSIWTTLTVSLLVGVVIFHLLQALAFPGAGGWSFLGSVFGPVGDGSSH